MQYRVRALWDHCLPVIINDIEIRRVVILVCVLTIKHHLHDFFFSHKHITSFLLPSILYLCVTSPVAGQAPQGNKTKPSGFSGPTLPYAAPTLNNTLSRSQSQHCSLLVLALCMSLSEELTGHRPFKQHFSSLNLVQWCCFDSIFSEIRQIARLNNSHSTLEWLYLPFLLVLDISCPSKYKHSISNSCLTVTPSSHCLVQLTSLASVYRMTVWVNSVAKPF